MRLRAHLYWHEPSNLLAWAKAPPFDIAWFEFLDDDHKGPNPMAMYPIDVLLRCYGWVDLGPL